MKSPAGSEALARCKIVGWPAAGIPWNTLSTKPGPYTLLKIWTQALPHCVVDALAGSVVAAPRPPATVSAAAAASTLLLMDMTVPFLGTAVPRPWGRAAAPGRLRSGVVRCGRSAPVAGQERGQRGQRLLGSLLGGKVAAAGDDQGLHVVGGELHRVRDLFAQAVRAADGQDGHGQP